MKCFGRYLAAWLIVCCIGGCAPEKTTADAPTRILSLSAAATAVLEQLGTPPAAIDQHGIVAASSGTPEIIGRGDAVSRERLVELGIDCAVLWYYQQGAAEQFREYGIRCVTIPRLRLANYPELIRQMGQLTGRHAAAERLAAAFRENAAQWETVSAERPPVRVYFELYAPWKAVGDGSYIGDLIRCAGGRCIARDSGLISPESVVEAAPEVIFLVDGIGRPEDFAARPGMAAVPAVKARRIYPVPRHLLVEGVAPVEAIRFLQAGIRGE